MSATFNSIERRVRSKLSGGSFHRCSKNFTFRVHTQDTHHKRMETKRKRLLNSEGPLRSLPLAQRVVYHVETENGHDRFSPPIPYYLFLCIILLLVYHCRPWVLLIHRDALSQSRSYSKIGKAELNVSENLQAICIKKNLPKKNKWFKLTDVKGIDAVSSPLFQTN